MIIMSYVLVADFNFRVNERFEFYTEIAERLTIKNLYRYINNKNATRLKISYRKHI